MKKIPIRLKKNRIETFCRKHHIIYLALFGSILTSKFTNDSDIDVLVEFEHTHIPHLFSFVTIEEELSSIIGRTVDLKTKNDLSPYFRDEVVSNAKIIYSE